MMKKLLKLLESSHLKEKKVNTDSVALLTVAIENNQVDKVKYLLKHRASVHGLNRQGLLPLVVAAKANKPQMIKLLIEHKAVLGHVRALAIAKQEGNMDIIKALFSHDKKRIEEYLSKHLKTISIDEARRSHPEYLQMMENMFSEQAARVLQRKWRENVEDQQWLHKIKLKHPEKKFTVNRKEVKYNETLNGKLSMRFIQEPWDNKASEHAKCINAGKWLELDFEDAEFERNIYKALRRGEITADRMVTADLLYLARQEFENRLRMHLFEEKGPYDLARIDYATKAKIASFKQKLKELPQQDQNYFSINCSRLYEYTFLKCCVNRGKDAAKLAKMKDMLNKFVRKLDISTSEKQALNADIDNLANENQEIVINSRKNILSAIVKAYPEGFEFYSYNPKASLFLRSQERESPLFAAALFAVNEPNPLIEISPDYDESDETSPFLCRIIPNMSALKVLQEAMHGKEYNTDPFYTAGQITPSFIRWLDEKPESYGLTRQARPVELVHPDLKSNQTPHDAYVHHFELTAHDIFHCWRNGSNPAKPMYRYLRQLLDTKGYAMSKAIWKLTDMDGNSGRVAQMAIKTTGDWNRVQLFVLCVKNWYKEGFFVKTDQYDDNLLLIIDLLVNKEKWNLFLDFYPDETPITFDDKPFSESYDKTMDEMKKVIATHKDVQPKNLYLFYILAYRMRNCPECLVALRQLVADGHDLTTYLKWGRNEGISFQHSDKFILYGDRAIEKMRPEAIASCFNDIIEKTKQKSLSDIKDSLDRGIKRKLLM